MTNTIHSHWPQLCNLRRWCLRHYQALPPGLVQPFSPHLLFPPTAISAYQAIPPILLLTSRRAPPFFPTSVSAPLETLRVSVHPLSLPCFTPCHTLIGTHPHRPCPRAVCGSAASGTYSSAKARERGSPAYTRVRRLGQADFPACSAQITWGACTASRAAKERGFFTTLPFALGSPWNRTRHLRVSVWGRRERSETGFSRKTKEELPEEGWVCPSLLEPQKRNTK